MLLRRQAESDDLLMLLAAIAQQDDYETPAEALAEKWSADAAPDERASDPELRRAQVLAVVLAVGGDS